MKFLKWLMVLLGLASAGALAFFLVRLFWRWNTVMGYAQANRSTAVDDPRVYIWLSVAAALLAGLLLGIGLALPRRTAHSIRRSARDEFEAARTAELNTQARVSDAAVDARRTTTNTLER